MNRAGLVIAFSFLLGVSACSEQSTEIIATQSGDETSTIVTEVEASAREEVPTTFAPSNTEPDTSRTSEMEQSDPQETVDTDRTSSADQEWRSHPLAALVLTPERLGDTWEIDNVDILEPEPGDVDQLVCGVPEPATLDGLEVELVGYEPGTEYPDQEMFQLVARGTPAEAQAWIDAFIGLGDCDGSDEYDPTEATLADVSVVGSDSVVGLYLTDNDASGAAKMRFVGARFGGVVVIVVGR